MREDWQTQSQVADIFKPDDNPVLQFIRAADISMNSNTFLLKGIAAAPIDGYLFNLNGFFSTLLDTRFVPMMLEFDDLSRWHNYHEWHEDVPEIEADFYAGYKPIPGIEAMLKPKRPFRLKPMSYLRFIEHMHWMLQTAPAYHPRQLDETTALNLIHGALVHLFGKETWTGENPPDSTQWTGLPNWIPHTWTFYSVSPTFLHSSGYWYGDDDDLNSVSYFDGGTSDSCTFFFRDTVFYLLLTNGMP